MKIVRLTESKGTTAYFDNIFNDEIELPPFSEVALSSVSINTEPKTLNITNYPEFDWKHDTPYSATLFPLPYDGTNFNLLFNEIEGSMNDETDASDPGINNEAVGLQWAVSDKPQETKFGKQGRVSIGYQVGNLEGASVGAFKRENITGSGAALDAVYSKTAAGDGVLISKVPMGWGGSRFYVNLKKILEDTGGAPPSHGVIIGLSEFDHVASGTTPDQFAEDTVMSIQAEYTGSKIYGTLNDFPGGRYVVGSDDGADVLAGDMIGFERQENGFVRGMTYSTSHPNGRILNIVDGSDTKQMESVWNQQEFGDYPLYPFVIFLTGDAFTQIDQVQFSPDPYKSFAMPTYPKLIQKTNGTRGMQNTGASTTGFFNFNEAANVGEYLGFTKTQQKKLKETVAMPNKSFAWTADELFELSLQGQGFYVELMTGTCEGYDGQTGQRKNILAVIPESDSDDKILFQPAFPTFLELNNSHPLVLRNIRARVLQTDGSSIDVTGLNSLTLLYKSGKSQ